MGKFQLQGHWLVSRKLWKKRHHYKLANLWWSICVFFNRSSVCRKNAFICLQGLLIFSLFLCIFYSWISFFAAYLLHNDIQSMNQLLKSDAHGWNNCGICWICFIIKYIINIQNVSVTVTFWMRRRWRIQRSRSSYKKAEARNLC